MIDKYIFFHNNIGIKEQPSAAHAMIVAHFPESLSSLQFAKPYQCLKLKITLISLFQLYIIFKKQMYQLSNQQHLMMPSISSNSTTNTILSQSQSSLQENQLRQSAMMISKQMKQLNQFSLNYQHLFQFVEGTAHECISDNRLNGKKNYQYLIKKDNVKEILSMCFQIKCLMERQFKPKKQIYSHQIISAFNDITKGLKLQKFKNVFQKNNEHILKMQLRNIQTKLENLVLPNELKINKKKDNLRRTQLLQKTSSQKRNRSATEGKQGKQKQRRNSAKQNTQIISNQKKRSIIGLISNPKYNPINVCKLANKVVQKFQDESSSNALYRE